MNNKVISFCQGKGSLSHNNRLFSSKNVDSTRSHNNVTFVHIPIDKAYDECFSDAVKRYNEKQKRPDRRIKCSYYEYVFSQQPSNSVNIAPNKKKSFYEIIIQIGDRNNTATDSADGKQASDCLQEYMNGFQKRNTNFFVFNAVLHMDESTPHLHIDYIPIGHYNTGIDTQNGMAQALKEMGFGDGENAINRWRIRECKILKDICSERGIKIAEPRKGRGYSFSVNEYKKYMDKIAELNCEIDKKTQKLETLMQIEEIADKEGIEHVKLPFGKCAISDEEFEKLKKFKQSLYIKNYELTNREAVIIEKEKQLSKNQSITEQALNENKILRKRIEEKQNEYQKLLNNFMQKKQTWNEMQDMLKMSEEEKEKEKKKTENSVNFILQIVMLTNRLLTKIGDQYDDICDYATPSHKQLADTIRYMAKCFVSYIGYPEIADELFSNAGFTKNTKSAFLQCSPDYEEGEKYNDR